MIRANLTAQLQTSGVGQIELCASLRFIETNSYSIPGPVEIADEVLYANAHPFISHVSADFVPVLGDCIRMTRYVAVVASPTMPQR
jgi:hypothetical protein